MKRYIKSNTPNEPNQTKSGLVREIIKRAKEIRDYFQYHNNNLNRRQEQILDDLSDGIDNQSISAIREAIENLKYNSKNMRSGQYDLIIDLYNDFNLANGKFEGMGYPEADDDDNINGCDRIQGSTKPRYMANMVNASDDSYEQLAAGDDTDSEDYIEYGKYYVAGYLQSSYRGLMEDLYSDDFEEILVNAADMAGQGLYVEITNRADGRSERYTPEDFEEAASNGDYPDHIREDLAL